MKSALAALVIGVAAASIPGAAAGRGIGLSASPLRLTFRGASAATIAVRNPGRRTLVVDASRAGFSRSLRGRPRVRPSRAAAWLRLRPRRLRIPPGGKATLHVRAAPPRHAEPGDHPALVLLTTRSLGVRRVRFRLRVGVVVDLHVRGRIVRRLEARSLTVRRARGKRHLLELHLVNRGNVTERLGGDRLRLVLLRHGRRLASLRPRRRELLPHSAGIAVFAYRGRARGKVQARIVLRPPGRGRRSFHIRL